MSHRLFVAIRPPASVMDALIDTMDGVEGARWQSEEQLHLTLRFIGEVERPQANELAEALATVSAPPFALEVAGTGHFERKGRVHALWARVLPSPALELLQGRVERACRAVELVPETRKFVPHVTLARLAVSPAAAAPWLQATGALRVPAWPVGSFGLWESRMGKGGSVYEEVVSYPLAPPAKDAAICPGP